MRSIANGPHVAMFSCSGTAHAAPAILLYIIIIYYCVSVCLLLLCLCVFSLFLASHVIIILFAQIQLIKTAVNISI